MSQIKLGVSLVCDRILELPGWVKAVENAGFDALGVGDSPALYPEVYSQGTIAALNTSRVMFGPRVSNPLTRHLSVTASGMATISQLSGGRAVLGIGTGDSAVYSVGQRPATLQYLRNYIQSLRAMLTVGETTFEGLRITCGHRARVPVYIAAHGPASLRMAGEIGDGVIVGGGVSRELAAYALEHIDQGARLAGRRVEDLDVWWLIGASIDASTTQAIDGIKTHLAAAANATFRLGTKDKLVPAEVEPAISELIRGYDFMSHEHAGSGRSNVELVERLGLTDYLASRFTLAGTAQEFARRIEECAGWGARNLWMTMPRPDKIGFLDEVRNTVMPRVRASG